MCGINKSIVLGIMCGLHRRNHCARFIKEARGLPVSLKHCHPSSEMDLSIWIIPFNFVPHYKNYPTTPHKLGPLPTITQQDQVHNS